MKHSVMALALLVFVGLTATALLAQTLPPELQQLQQRPPKKKPPTPPNAPIPPARLSGRVGTPGNGPTVAPPGSVIIPPGAMPQAPGPSDRRRTGNIARCNDQQIVCNNNCNHNTFGQARNMCYRQCKSQFVHCTDRINTLR